MASTFLISKLDKLKHTELHTAVANSLFSSNSSATTTTSTTTFSSNTNLATLTSNSLNSASSNNVTNNLSSLIDSSTAFSLNRNCLKFNEPLVINQQPLAECNNEQTIHTNETLSSFVQKANCSNDSLNTLASQFIDPFDLKKKLFEIQSKIIIFLDCRSFNDFNLKRIKDSVHLNCRDRLTKKRLQTLKLSVKDLISCEQIKNKFEIDTNKVQSATQSRIATSFNSLNNSNHNEKTKNDNRQTGDMVVIYDETTTDPKDLQNDSNPLRIVQENMRRYGFKNQCKILKGGFKQFFEICPEFCENKLSDEFRINLNTAENLNCPGFNKPIFDSDQVDQQQSAIENAVMNQIMPHLYLGNEMDAQNLKKLGDQGVFYIMNVTKNIPFYDNQLTPEMKKKFTFKRVEVNDCLNQNLKLHFQEAIDFIDEAKENNSKVLVHCQAGISRSPTIVIAYLMKKLNLTMNEAYNRVKEIRPIVAPNLVFMSQLMDFEEMLAKSSTNNANTNSSNNDLLSGLKKTISACSSFTNLNSEMNLENEKNTTKMSIECS